MSCSLNSTVGGTGNVPRTSSGSPQPLQLGTALAQDLYETRGRAQRQLGIDAAFESVRTFGAQGVAFRASRDAHRIEVGRLEKYVGRGVTDLTRRAAHDARESEHVVVAVDDDAVLTGVPQSPSGGRELALDAIEGHERFTGTGASRAERPTGDVLRVVGVRRLAEFEHHQIGRVDHVGDRSHPRALDARDDPRGRRNDLDVTKDRDREATTEVGCVDAR